MLGETILAIHRTIFSRLERNFAFLAAIAACRLVHFSGPVIVLTAALKSHTTPPDYVVVLRRYAPAPITWLLYIIYALTGLL